MIRFSSRSAVLWLGLALVLAGFFSPVLVKEGTSLFPLVPVESGAWLAGAAVFLTLLAIAKWLRFKAMAGLAAVTIVLLGGWAYEVLSEDRRNLAEAIKEMSSEKGQFGLFVNPVELGYGFFLIEVGLALVVVSRLCFRPGETLDRGLKADDAP